MIFSSLLVCLVRDPGNPNVVTSRLDVADGGHDDDDDELELSEALISDNDYTSPDKWCRKCWVCTLFGMAQCFNFLKSGGQAPKPERTHHCSICGRCVLKMGMWIF